MATCNDCGGNVIIHGDCMACTALGSARHAVVSATLRRDLEAALAGSEIAAAIVALPARELEHVA